MLHTTEARTISPGRKLSYILTRSFSVARTSCTRMTPCHSASSTVSPHTRMATTAWRGVMRVTRQSTALPTCGRTSRCFLAAASRATEMVGRSAPWCCCWCCCSPAPAAREEADWWSAALSLFWRLGGPRLAGLLAPAVFEEEEEVVEVGWETVTAPRREL